MVHIVECPRDAMQGKTEFVPTNLKIEYLKKLLKVGFQTLDFTSFVSPKAIPQMADCHEVTKALESIFEKNETNTKLLAIVANQRGADDALQYPHISYLGFPFSISETFQQRNTHQSIAQATDIVKEIQEKCQKANRSLVVYLSMGFGNPYNDQWNTEILEYYAQKMVDLGIQIISLADTLGNANPKDITSAFSSLVPKYPNCEFGAHFHATPQTQVEKLSAAWQSGCRRFDGALLGFGGCPFADDHLVGNINTETLIHFINQQEPISLDMNAYQEAVISAIGIFN